MSIGTSDHEVNSINIVTWNSNLTLRKKLDRLLGLNPDVAVVQECERDLSVPEGYHYNWVGENPRKGLGVLVKDDTATVHPSWRDEWTYFLPLELGSSELKILATWAFNHRADRVGSARVGNPISVIEELDGWLSQGRSLMVGDFNNSVVWDRKGKADNFAAIDAALNQHGLASAYHQLTGEGFGQESRPTFLHQKNPTKSYHIDYCYVHHSLGVRDVRVLPFDDWKDLSDHVPVVTVIAYDE